MTTKRRQIDFSDVQSVYSGKNGKCCCGCSGKHWKADKSKQVRRILKIVNNATKVESIRNGKFNDYVSTVIGERLYVVYLNMGKK